MQKFCADYFLSKRIFTKVGDKNPNHLLKNIKKKTKRKKIFSSKRDNFIKANNFFRAISWQPAVAIVFFPQNILVFISLSSLSWY